MTCKNSIKITHALAILDARMKQWTKEERVQFVDLLKERYDFKSGTALKEPILSKQSIEERRENHIVHCWNGTDWVWKSIPKKR